MLEFTPGAEVTQSGLYDYNFNTRGFNSSLNRRVATLVDGRDPSVPFLGAQEWAAVSFPLDDLQSAELVRGPSAALYGANAASGVLNLTTKAPRNSLGGQVRLTAGELSTVNGDLRWAGSLGRDWYLKLLGGVRTSEDFTVSRNGKAEYSVPCTTTVTSDCLPQERVPLTIQNDDQISFQGLRLDKYFGDGSLWTLEGGAAQVEGPVFQTGIGRVQLVEVDRQWARSEISTEHWTLLGNYNRRDAPKQTALSAGTNLALDDKNYGGELQTRWELGEKTRLVFGGSYTVEKIDSRDPATGQQTLMFEPIDAYFAAVFGQLDWNVTDQVKLVLAGRYDESDLHDSQVSPKGSIVWGITPDHSLRLTYNEAFQVPNYSEFFLQANAAAPLNLQAFEAFCTPYGVSCGFAPGPTRVLALGNKDLEVEEVRTAEIGYTGILGGKAFLTVDYYRSENENFITDLLSQLGTTLGRINPNFGPYQAPATLPAPAAAALLATLQGALGSSFALLSNNLDGTQILAAASYTNFGAVDTQGIDLGLNVYLANRWTLSFAYSWFDFEFQDSAAGLDRLLLPNSPENKVTGGLSYAAERYDWAVNMRWVDDFRWVVGPFQGEIPSYTTVDLVANFDLGEHWTLGLNVANALDEEHWEAFGGDIVGRRALGTVAFRW